MVGVLYHEWWGCCIMLGVLSRRKNGMGSAGVVGSAWGDAHQGGGRYTRGAGVYEKGAFSVGKSWAQTNESLKAGRNHAGVGRSGTRRGRGRSAPLAPKNWRGTQR